MSLMNTVKMADIEKSEGRDREQNNKKNTTKPSDSVIHVVNDMSVANFLFF